MPGVSKSQLDQIAKSPAHLSGLPSRLQHASGPYSTWWPHMPVLSRSGQNPAHGRGKLRDAVLELRKAKMARRRAA